MENQKKFILAFLSMFLLIGISLFATTDVVNADRCTPENRDVTCTVLTPDSRFSGHQVQYQGRIEARRRTIGGLWARVDEFHVGTNSGGSAGTATGTLHTPTEGAVVARSAWVTDLNTPGSRRTIGRTSN